MARAWTQMVWWPSSIIGWVPCKYSPEEYMLTTMARTCRRTVWLVSRYVNGVLLKLTMHVLAYFTFWKDGVKEVKIWVECSWIHYAVRSVVIVVCITLHALSVSVIYSRVLSLHNLIGSSPNSESSMRWTNIALSGEDGERVRQLGKWCASYLALQPRWIVLVRWSFSQP